MVSVLDSGSNDPGWSLARDIAWRPWVRQTGSECLSPPSLGVQMTTGDFNAEDNPAMD